MSTKTKNKPAVATKTATKASSGSKERKETKPNYLKTVTIVDFSKVPHGSYFSAIFGKRTIYGRIVQKGGQTYLAQNVSEGTSSGIYFDLRYNAQVYCTSGIQYARGFENVQILSEKPKGYVPSPTVRIGDYFGVFRQGYFQVGCTTIPNNVIRESILPRLIERSKTPKVAAKKATSKRKK